MGWATADSLYNPIAVYIDRQDTLYVGDTGNSRLLHFLKPAVMYHGASLASNVPVCGRLDFHLEGSVALINQAVIASGNILATTSLGNRQVVMNDQLLARRCLLYGPGSGEFPGSFEYAGGAAAGGGEDSRHQRTDRRRHDHRGNGGPKVFLP